MYGLSFNIHTNAFGDKEYGDVSMPSTPPNNASKSSFDSTSTCVSKAPTHINTSPIVFKLEEEAHYFSSQDDVDLQSEVSVLKNTVASMQQNFVLLQSENKSQAELIDKLKDKIGLLESELKETDEWVEREVEGLNNRISKHFRHFVECMERLKESMKK